MASFAGLENDRREIGRCPFFKYQKGVGYIYIYMSSNTSKRVSAFGFLITDGSQKSCGVFAITISISCLMYEASSWL